MHWSLRFPRLLSVVALLAAMTPPVNAADTKLYWGDTHLHTSYSFDVYLFGTFAATPDTAYRFARGLPVVSPTTQTRWQLSRPLDFLVVADHAEVLGAVPGLFAGHPAFADTETGKLLLKVAGSRSAKELQAVYDLLASIGSGVKTPNAPSAAAVLRRPPRRRKAPKHLERDHRCRRALQPAGSLHGTDRLGMEFAAGRREHPPGRVHAAGRRGGATVPAFQCA